MFIIEKQVMAFFKILLKEFENTSAQEGNQKLIQSQSPCSAYGSERLTKLKKEIEELCHHRKSDLSEIAYTFYDYIQNKTSRVYKQSTLEKSK